MLLGPVAVQAHPHPISIIKHHKLLILTSAIFLAASLFDAGYIAFNWFGTKDTGLTGTHDIPADWKEKHKWFYRAIWLEKPSTVAIMGWATEAHARAAWHNAQIPASK